MATTKPAPTDEASDELLARFINDQTHRSNPGEARIAGYGYPVWIVIDALAATGGDVDRVARDYELPGAAVRAALAFYHRRRDAINARARANAAVYGSFA